MNIHDQSGRVVRNSRGEPYPLLPDNRECSILDAVLGVDYTNLLDGKGGLLSLARTTLRYPLLFATTVVGVEGDARILFPDPQVQPFYLRIGQEIVACLATGNRYLMVKRAQQGTERQDHEAGTAVQLEPVWLYPKPAQTPVEADEPTVVTTRSSP